MAEKKLNEAIFVYDDNVPGILTSEKGLLPGQYVVVMYKGNRVPIENIVRFGDDGYISRMEAFCNNGLESEESKNPFYYRVDIWGIGPSSGYGSISVKDGTSDTYSFRFCTHKSSHDYIRCQIIHTITWEPMGPINV